LGIETVERQATYPSWRVIVVKANFEDQCGLAE